MINTKELKTHIKDSGLRMGFIASKLGISKQCLYNKLNNQSEFSVEQAFRLRELMNLDDLSMRNIFFSECITSDVKEVTYDR